MQRPLLLAALLSLGLAPAPFLKKKAAALSDLERMQGNWKWTTDTSELRIQGDSFTYYRNGAPSVGYKITLNPNATPRQYDLTGVGKWAGRRFHGIYEFQGDTLRMYSVNSRQPRPRSFPPPGSSRLVKDLKRTTP